MLVQDLKLTNERLAKMLSMIRGIWDGDGMKWVYDDVQEEVPHKHGVLVLVRTKWARFMHGLIRDEGKWGRYAGVIFVGHGVGSKGR